MAEIVRSYDVGEFHVRQFEGDTLIEVLDIEGNQCFRMFAIPDLEVEESEHVQTALGYGRSEFNRGIALGRLQMQHELCKLLGIPTPGQFEALSDKIDALDARTQHIRRVGELLCDCTAKLNLRAVKHDASKWSPEEWPFFEAVTPRLAGIEYGSEEYKANLREIRPAIDHHQSVNSHHAEFHASGINGMSLLDLLEMLCDWKAAGERHDTGCIIKSLEINRAKLGIEDQLFSILLKTVEELGWRPKSSQELQAADGTLITLGARMRITGFLHDCYGYAGIVSIIEGEKVFLRMETRGDCWAHKDELIDGSKAAGPEHYPPQ